MMSEMMSIPGDLNAHVDFFFFFSLLIMAQQRAVNVQPGDLAKQNDQFSSSLALFYIYMLLEYDIVVISMVETSAKSVLSTFGSWGLSIYRYGVYSK